MIDYAAAKKETPYLKSQLTRAKKQGPQAVVNAVSQAYDAFDRWGAFPDGWHLWENALRDAKDQARREGLTLNFKGTRFDESPVEVKASLPENILEAIRQRRGLEPDDKSQDEDINNLPMESILDAYFAWEGIYGYTQQIISIVVYCYRDVLKSE